MDNSPSLKKPPDIRTPPIDPLPRVPTIETSLVLPSLSVTADILSATSSADLPTPMVPLIVTDGMLLTPVSSGIDYQIDSVTEAAPKLASEMTPNASKLSGSKSSTTPTPSSKTLSSTISRVLYAASSTTTPSSTKSSGGLLRHPRDQERVHYFDRGPPHLGSAGIYPLALGRAMPRHCRPPDCITMTVV